MLWKDTEGAFWFIASPCSLVAWLLYCSTKTYTKGTKCNSYLISFCRVRSQSRWNTEKLCKSVCGRLLSLWCQIWCPVLHIGPYHALIWMWFIVQSSFYFTTQDCTKIWTLFYSFQPTSQKPHDKITWYCHKNFTWGNNQVKTDSNDLYKYVHPQLIVRLHSLKIHRFRVATCCCRQTSVTKKWVWNYIWLNIIYLQYSFNLTVCPAEQLNVCWLLRSRSQPLIRACPTCHAQFL